MRPAALALAVLLTAGAAATGDAAPPGEGVLHGDAIPTGPSLAERLAEIRRRVQRAASYPPLARQRGLVGETLVEFAIGPEGAPELVRIRRSSGSPLLDRAAESAVRRAAPLPPVYGRVAVPVRFELDDGAPSSRSRPSGSD
jgi:TonB family protein